MDLNNIRNFCIVAHIDHGKSTLADRLLEYTGTIEKRLMQEQILDQMELERERGITIKAQAVRMSYCSLEGEEYQLNLIDTPGHVDFSYEVSRSLAACEGAILVVDASQGIQAQTLANVYIALEYNLTLIPVINKIDLPNAEPEKVALELEKVLGFSQADMIFASAKEGTGIPEILEAIVERIPSPKGNPEGPLTALIFDSKYDPYKGVVAYVRLIDGHVKQAERLKLMFIGKSIEALEIGIFKPWLTPVASLFAGEVGYIATGLKNVRECQVGDTITSEINPASQPLSGYRPAKPMVFAGLYPIDSNDYPLLRDALDKMKLNDASLSYEPESSTALGFGFRCGFLGLLHMDIVRERLEREYDLNLLITAPSVAYQVIKKDGTKIIIDNPANLPSPMEIEELQEPWMTISIITPSQYLGSIMELVQDRRGIFKKMEYLGQDSKGQGGQRVLLEYEIPLSCILMNFYDELKSRSQGYASMDYSFLGYRPARLAKLDIMLNGQPVDALSTIVLTDEAYQRGRAMVEKLRHVIPRQLFDVAIQAAVGQRIVARETIKALRKNVLAKCYGGDITRKRKLLEKQAEGKKKLKRIGQVEVPREAFLEVLHLE